MAYFIFNNINSKDMGIIVKKTPARTVPAEKKELIQVIGRNGYLTYSEDAYAPITISIECTLKPTADIDNVISWLLGRGKLILSDIPDRYYEVEIVNNIPFEKVFKIWRNFIIQFESQPLAKSNEEEEIDISSGTNIITLNCTANVYPVIEIIGSGEFRILVNNEIINLNGITTNVKIDNELMNVTSIDGLINLNNKLNGNFIKLIPRGKRN